MVGGSASSALLTKVECIQILRNSLKLSSDDQINFVYEIKRAENDLVGFMGDYFKLKITLEDKGSPTGAKVMEYFVKSAPVDDEARRNDCLKKGFFNKEGRIYMEILPNLQRYATTKLFAECYYAREDLIVLEDISLPEMGYRHMDGPIQDNTTDCNLVDSDHCELVMIKLAEMHAASIAWERKEGFDIATRFADVLVELQLNMSNDWFETGVRSILFLAKMHPKYQTPRALEYINNELYKTLSGAEALTNPSQKFQNVFCHRDVWDKNILFKYDFNQPKDCCFVDFQLARYSPPGIDVWYYLYTSLPAGLFREARAENENFYVGTYQHYLKETLWSLGCSADTVDPWLVETEFQQARLAALILWAIGEPLMNMPEGLAEKWRKEEPENYDVYMNKNREEMFLRIMAMDTEYKQTILRPIEELMDYLFATEEEKQEKYFLSLV